MCRRDKNLPSEILMLSHFGFKYYTVHVLYDRACVTTGAGGAWYLRFFLRPYCLAPAEFLEDQLTLFKPGGRLCPPHYYLAPAAPKYPITSPAFTDP